MKHNLILCLLCSFLNAVVIVHTWIGGNIGLTPGIILFVAACYFGGRYLDKCHD